VDLQAFTAAVEAELQLRRVPFSLRDLIAFLEDERRHVEGNPDVELWALMFLKRQRLVAALRKAGAEGGGLYVHFLEQEG
jgi:hypothetical protein